MGYSESQSHNRTLRGNYSMSSTMNSRKHFLINKQFQIRFMMYSFALVAIVAIVIGYSGFYFIQSLLEEAERVGAGSGGPFIEYLQGVRTKLVTINVIAVVALGIMIVSLSLLLSHRVAGPIHHLITYLREKKVGGQSGPLKFRESDFFPELAEAINEYTDQGKK
jgi:methyl-accepting chemotaxis protein